jgi:hypothetical protein
MLRATALLAAAWSGGLNSTNPEAQRQREPPRSALRSVTNERGTQSKTVPASTFRATPSSTVSS